jgi:hypothetical protein
MACPSCGAPIDAARRFDEVYHCEYCGNTAYFTQHLAAAGPDGASAAQGAPIAGLYSRFKIGQHGTLRGKLEFNVLGMVQVEYPSGFWTEWRLRVGEQEYWLQEDEGIYVLFDSRPIEEPLPPISAFQPGANLEGWNRLPRWFIIEVAQGKVIGYQGQLPFPPNIGETFTYVDGLGGGQVISMEIDSDGSSAALSVGEPLEYEDIQVAAEETGGW